jgi:predicted amidohydrolase YtcJ
MPEGALALPGFFDSHTHFAQHGFADLHGTYLTGIRDIDHLLDLVRDRAERVNAGDVLILDGMDETEWPERTRPTRTDLDRVCPEVPVFVRRICGHVTICSTRAVERLPEGVSPDDPERGVLNTSNIDLRDWFPPDPEETKRGILHAQTVAHSLGITSIYDYGKLRHFKAYRALEKEGKLEIRVHFAFYPDQADIVLSDREIRETRSSLFRVRGFKIYLDGSVGARTAAFVEPYADDPGKTGVLYRSQDEVETLLRRADDAGLQVSFHAIGDRALEMALRALERAGTPGNPLRHRIEHFSFPHHRDIERAKELGIYICMQPNFVANWGAPGKLYSKRLSKHTLRRSHPFRALLRRGIPLAFSSDSMPPSPLYGIEGAIDHPVRSERLTVWESLRAYTSAGARFSGRENHLGVIREGYTPDLAILSHAPDSDVDRPDVLALFLGGVQVFGAGKLSPGASQT